MGSACCVAARDRTITSRTPSETLQRHARHSPSWSFLLDNRGRVAGEETTTNILLNGGGGDDHLDVKSATTVETAFASEEGSSLDSFRSLACRKSPVSDGNGGILRFPSSDPSVSRNLVELKEPAESAAVPYTSPVKLSPSAPSVSPMSTSPLSSHSHLLPPNSTPSRWSRRSPGQQLLRQVSDSPIPEYKTPAFSISEEASSFVLPAWGCESTRGSNGGSSDGWSIPPFSELLTTRKERWSFDSENSGFSRDKITRSAGRNSESPSFDLQSCGVCAKLLPERSLLGSQKIIATNELAVVAVLICGHVYHAECLEYMTPEINKYDPACPVCTFGEKRTMKMSEKAIKAELDSKARKRSRNRVVDSDDLIVFDHKCGGHEGRGPKMSSSSSMKSSSGKPFLRRHFSFGSKGNKSLSENHSTRKKGFFWSKSSKE
ncbi:RING/U-box superfamily protein [Forsythia ovata]|uniref:RING/U-box superfamily protein n=1 Tax=Forsythia ovata TaxID=205694 RepID=A0ABD1QLY1_9LAMI